MTYIDKQLSKIQAHLLKHGHAVNEDALSEVGEIIAYAIIAGRIDSGLVDDAIKWGQDVRDKRKIT